MSSVTSTSVVPSGSAAPPRTGTAGTPGRPPRGRRRCRPRPAAAGARPAGRCPANRGWSCGKPALAANASCHTGACSRSASSTRAAQVSAWSASAPTTSAGDAAPDNSATSSSTAAGSAPVARRSTAGAASSMSSAGAAQSSLGTIDHRGPASVDGLVPRPCHRARHVLRARGLVHPYRVVARQPLQVAREERAVDEMPSVLLADDHHQRHPVAAGRRQRAHGVAQSRGGVQVHQRRRSVTVA